MEVVALGVGAVEWMFWERVAQGAGLRDWLVGEWLFGRTAVGVCLGTVTK